MGPCHPAYSLQIGVAAIVLAMSRRSFRANPRQRPLYSPIQNSNHFRYYIDIMEIRRLRYFVAVAEELSFTRAAERLHIAQPPLSIQIKALEQEVGARLFDRDQRHVFLTQAGKHLLGRARDILGSVEAAKAEVRCAALGEVGSLHLGYASSAMFTSSLTWAIKQFQSGFPHVLLTLHEMTSLDQLNALHYRTLDAGILRKSDVPAPSGILIEEWYRAPLVAAMANDHPLAKKRAIRISDLRDQPLIMYPRESGIGLYWQVLRLCANAGFRPQIAREVQQLTTILGLVAAREGIAIVPGDTRGIHLDARAHKPPHDKQRV